MCLDNYQKIAIGLFSLKSGGNSEIYKKWEVGVKIWRVTPKSGDLASMHIVMSIELLGTLEISHYSNLAVHCQLG